MEPKYQLSATNSDKNIRNLLPVVAKSLMTFTVPQFIMTVIDSLEAFFEAGSSFQGS